MKISLPVVRATENDTDIIKDGLRYCAVCGEPKQTKIKIGGKYKIVGCSCKCEMDAFLKEQEAIEENNRRIRIDALRANGINDYTLKQCTFDSAEGSDAIIKCRRYVQNWGKMKEGNVGLLMWGTVGAGKTYAAACIANGLIDEGVSVLMTSFPKILNSGYEHLDLIKQMAMYDLLIIDDLGVERSSQYALETVYMVIDERYKCGKPLIVTTNLLLKDIKDETDISRRRIYDRLLGMCVPIEFKGESKRASEKKSKFEIAASLL